MSFAAQAYSGMQVLRATIHLDGPTRADIQNEVGTIRDTPTVRDRFSFDISPDALHAPIIDQIPSGHITQIFG
ncbi:MAG TPA: hypothetical protein VMU99_05685 [Acidimicrobiales bacterium]|nr:hypothetical protein [Acidimicrobiales bacterium]